MAHAYTPGLKVTERALIRKTRRLPIPGEVLVREGDRVLPSTIVARTNIPGDPQTLSVANLLGVEPSDIKWYMVKKEGDRVQKGDVIAEYKAFFGLMRKTVQSPVDGTLEMISTITGQITVREDPIPIEVTGYIEGTVESVLPREGVVVKTEGALIQGIFGVGGETTGEIAVLASDPDEVLEAKSIGPEHKGKILVGGSLVTAASIKRAAEMGAVGVVAGGIVDTDLIAYLGHDIGVAITGHEEVPVTVIVTEGFGRMRMADRTFQLLKDLSGMRASINGATQIRAGVMRPEVIVPGYRPKRTFGTQDLSVGLVPGTPVRIIRQPYFGKLAVVVDLPPDLQVIETEAKVRILRAKLEDGTVVTIPRANVEIIEE